MASLLAALAGKPIRSGSDCEIRGLRPVPRFVDTWLGSNGIPLNIDRRQWPGTRTAPTRLLVQVFARFPLHRLFKEEFLPAGPDGYLLDLPLLFSTFRRWPRYL